MDQARPPKVALCLPGGGLTGALYQVGALAALEDGVDGLGDRGFSLYVGSSTGATVAAAVAGGASVERIYRALLDPVDNFFPLERSHILRFDPEEWNRTLATGWLALRAGVSRLTTRREPALDAPGRMLLLEQIDRLYDSLPAGIFKLDRYERFLAEFFLRRGIPNTFRAMPRQLRIPAYDIDTGERVVFGGPSAPEVPISLACAASLALPVFFSPVRIGDRHFIDGGVGHVAHLDVAEAEGATLTILVNPLVPISTGRAGVPTGHGVKDSVRDKGLLWVFNQGMRIGAHARLHQDVDRTRSAGHMEVVVLEPEPTDALLFLHNPTNLAARRAILEYAYKTTRERIVQWLDRAGPVAGRLGWHVR